MAHEAGITREPNRISVFICGFAAGIFFASFVSVPPLVSLLIIIVGFAVLVERKREVVLLSLFLISFGLGSLRYAIKDFHEVILPSAEGVIIDEPLETERARRFTYEADNGEKVIVSAPLYIPVSYGDRVRVEGKLKRPRVIEEESGRDFDYGAYLSKDDIYWTISFAEVEVLAHDEGNPLKAALLKVKDNFIAHIESILPEPQASLLAGLVVAGKGSLPKSVLEDFRKAGVVHIVVLSGFNVTLIAEFLRQLFVSLFLVAGLSAAPFVAAMASAVGIVLFVLMTGASATVVRAAAMAFIVLLAKHFGRTFSAPRALMLAGFAMLFVNPKLLVFDPSFQLSFLATLGLIYFLPPVERFFNWLPERFQFREIVWQTVATQLAVLPLFVYSTGNVSLVSLPANVAILPAVPFAMLAGFAATLVSYAGTLIAWPLSFISHLLLSYILAISHLFGSLPFATVEVSLKSLHLLLGLGIAVGGFFAFRFQIENLFSPGRLGAELKRRLKP